ncbi:hydantoinase/oxoprolinase N-terminal domain-containing protein [Amycolatopsis sp. NPDC051903]|uniref:hydantoinase/oxoprolinase N-terminal domain-containing protein n=1 Tax=Amycolatopsis sp. NPDC051903 TaxID=3363936 RepID=UPI0037ABE526
MNSPVPGPLRLGIDVGGTNTDAVVLDPADRIVAHTKQPTTDDVTTGVRAALDQVLTRLGPDGRRVRAVMLGTTHATNAIVERRNLAKVAVLRIGRQVAEAIPPLAAWPRGLRTAAIAGATQVSGGQLLDGCRIAPLDVEAVKKFLGSVAGTADALAATSVFAPVHPEDEVQVADLVRRELGDLPISLSHDLGALGLLERETTTTLNAALGPVITRVTRALREATAAHGIDARTYLAQNDGTLMDADHAARYPVLTIGSGPSNSLRGAALLSNVTDAIVADVGGTTTDLGVLVDGFARESRAGCTIGGVRTSLPMPDVLAIGFGGGTVLHPDRIGPDSVGHTITREALVFGGTTPTLTDAATALGRTAFTLHPVESLTHRFKTALDTYDDALEQAVALVSHGHRDQPVLAIGGGAELVPDRIGPHPVIRPHHAGVANAAGAAIALVTGENETLIPTGPDRTEALAAAKTAATTRAIQAGADPDTVTITRLQETPIAYDSARSLRVRVTAAGRLAL